MRKIITWAAGIACLASACQSKAPADYIVLSGKIENPTSQQILIVGSNFYRDTLTVQADGTFRDTLSLVPGSYLLSYDKLFWRSYLQNGYGLNVTFNSSDFKNTLKFSGIGGPENTYIFSKFDVQRDLMNEQQKAYQQDAATFKKLMQEQKAILANNLDTTRGLSSDFKAKESRNIHYAYLVDLLSYERRNQQAKGKQQARPVDFLAELNGFSYHSGTDFLFSDSYKRLVEWHIRKNAGEIAQKQELAEDLAYLESLAVLKNDTIRNYMAYQHARYGITYTRDLESFYGLFKKISTDSLRNAEIASSYQALQKVAKGQPSPAFTDYQNVDGSNTSLSDLKGTYLYIDVWATWCGPCRKEIPYLKQLEKEYHGRNIKFVSISIDTQENKGKWKKMVADKKLGGVQLLANKNWDSDFVKNYLIKGIPRFILLDPDGKIIDPNAPTPSSGELKSIFSNLSI